MSSSGNEKERSVVKDIINAVPKLLPLMFSHHPDCKPYRSDMLKIGKLKLCRGCTISYGIAIMMVISIFLFSPLRDQFENFPPTTIIFVGVMLGLAQVLRAVVKNRNVWFKTIVKIFLGIGIGLIIIGIIGLGYSAYVTVWIFFGLFILYGLIGGPLRFFYMRRTCMDCEYEADFDRCEGMAPIRDLD